MPAPHRPRSPVRRFGGPAVSFGGRIAGIAVTLLVVRYAGVGATAVPLLLAIALYGFAQSTLAGLLEIQAVAASARSMSQAPSRLLCTSLLLGAVSGTVMIVVAVVLSVLVPGMGGVAWYVAPLGLALPLAACFSAIQGIEIAKNNWTAPGVASVVRSATIVVLVALLIGGVGLAVVPAALLVGEMVRLALALRWSGILRVSAPGTDREFLRRVSQQILPSLLSSAAPTVDRILIVSLGLGSVALLDLADKSTSFLSLLVSQGLLPPMYGRWAQIKDSSLRRAKILATTRVVLIGSVGTGLLAAMVLPVVVARVGGISSPSARATLDLTVWFLLAGFPGYVASQVLVRLMILEGLHRWFNLTAGIQVVANVLLDLALGLRWGVAGVAAGTAIVWWLGLALCYGVIRGNSVHRAPSAARLAESDC